MRRGYSLFSSQRYQYPYVVFFVLWIVLATQNLAFGQSPKAEIERFIFKHVSDVPILSPGKFESSLGFTFERWKNVSVLRVPFSLKTGLCANTEIGAYSYFTILEPFGPRSEFGLNDITLYGKYSIVKERGPLIPGVAIGAKIFLPTGDEDKGFGMGDTYTGVFGALSKKFDQWVMHGDIGYIDFDTRGWNNYYYYGLGCMYKMSDSKALSLEIVGAEKVRSNWGESLEFLMGIQSLDNKDPNLIWQYGIGIGLQDSSPDWELIAKFNYLFGK